MNIRPATPGDYPAYAALFIEINNYHAAAQPETFAVADTCPRSLEEFTALLQDPVEAIFVAEIEGQVAGYIHLILRDVQPLAILKPRRLAVVDTVVVGQGFQRRGAGRALMHAGEQWATRRQAACVELNVWAFNDPALALYDALGYAPISHKLRKML